MATHAKGITRKDCPCGKRKINSGSELCHECRDRALRVCLQCGGSGRPMGCLLWGLLGSCGG